MTRYGTADAGRGAGSGFSSDYGGVLKRALFLALAVVLALTATRATAASVVALLGANLPPYQEVVRRFWEAFARPLGSVGPKSIAPDSLTEFVPPPSQPPAETVRDLRARRPDLVFAVGRRALELARELDSVPTVYLLVPAPGALAEGRPGLAGVPLEVPAAAWLEALRLVLPEAKALGVVYDPARTGPLVEEVRRLASGPGLRVVAEPVSSSREVPGRLGGLRGRIDALWLVPDPTVVTPPTVEAFASFSLAARVPLFAFADQYLEKGAAVSVTHSLDAMGQAAAVLARRLLAGGAGTAAPALAPRIALNRRALETLGTPLPADLFRDPRVHWLEPRDGNR